MKKAIKNYLAKLHDNKEKGFSLVELIIVMAIMAILVGVVASQVIPYMEKSRQSKDQQQLSSICTDMVSSIAQTSADSGEVSGFTGEDLDGANFKTGTLKTLGQNFADTRSAKDIGTAYTTVKGKLKSKAAKTGKYKIYVDYNDTTGVVTVYMTENGDKSGTKVAKLTAESE